jgi:hypothetical protein
VAAAAVAVVLGELIDVAAWLAPRIIRRASAHMPTPELQARYREEWLAELDQLDGLKLVKLAKAITIWANSWRASAEWESEWNGVGLTWSVRAFVRGVTASGRAAWRGDGPLTLSYAREFGWPEVSVHPAIAFLLLLLVAVPIQVTVTVRIKNADGTRMTMATMPSSGPEKRNARWLAPAAALLTVAFYDLYLLRSDTRIKDLPRRHIAAWKSIVIQRNAQSSSATPIDSDDDGK